MRVVCMQGVRVSVCCCICCLANSQVSQYSVFEIPIRYSSFVSFVTHLGNMDLVALSPYFEFLGVFCHRGVL